MKKLFVCATAVGLFMSVPALAAQNDDHHSDTRGTATVHSESSAPTRATHENGPTRATMQAVHSNTVFAHQNTPVHATETVAHNRTVTTHQKRPAVAVTGGTNENAGGTSTYSATSRAPFTANSARRDNSGSENSSVSAARTGHNPSVNSLRLNVQASRQFHNGDYRQPAGYQSRHWSYGERLPHSYFARDYWLMDYVSFGLFAPPDGLVWVRVGNDALLIDEISGDVVQVDYGVFY
jgi:Ni/Co efflux regulator RcnB